MRRKLPDDFPGVEFFFQPADMVTQILNFGLPAAVDVADPRHGHDSNYALAAQLANEISNIPGAVDVHIHQRARLRLTVRLEMDRTRLQQVNLTATTVAQDVLISLFGQPAGQPVVLAQPEERRVLQCHGADAAISGVVGG